MIRFTVWGKKKTMFPVAKQPRAIYVHAHYLGGHQMVAEVERNLRNFDEVTRFLSVRLSDEVDPETLESRRQPGLHFVGEVLNLDGLIGGYNFQAAWSTGWLAGDATVE